MPNLVPDGLSHVFCHGLQEFKADKELEGSLVERFVGRWCEIVLLSQKPTFGGGVFYFCSKTKWKRWWSILWKRILLQGKSELEWMKLFDFFGSLTTYLSIICAHHQNLRAHPWLPPPKKIRSDKQIIHHHHPNNKNCGIWGRKIKFSDGTRHPSDHLRFCRLLSIKVVLWPLQRKTCRLTERQGRFGFLEKPKTCKLGNPKEKPRGRDIFTGKTGKTPSFETRCFFGWFFVGSIGGEGAVLHEDRPSVVEVVGFRLCCGVTLFDKKSVAGGVGGDAAGPQRLALCLPGATAR